MTLPAAGVVRPNAVEVALGDAVEWVIQRWVVWTGPRVEAADAP